MKLYIKNMVCNRCKTVVENELKGFGIQPLHIDLGEVTITEELPRLKVEEINKALNMHGFEIIDDKRKRMIEQIKNLIVQTVHHADEPLDVNYSEIITAKLHHDYSYLSNLFSSVEGTTIEKYIILQKMERVKELIIYDELSLNQIADTLGFSSIGHLSGQFKKTTGMTPSLFKKLHATLSIKSRKSLDEV